MKSISQCLFSYLSGFKNLCVAFSGGVDSTFLLAAAKQAVPGRVLAINVSSFLITKEEISFAREMAAMLDAEFVRIDLGEIKDSLFLSNPVNRCYICKKIIFKEIIREAEKHGITAVADGTNADDKKDFRPGLKAVSELGVISPLAKTGFTKAAIRTASKAMGIITWNKPSSPCLATRIPYGIPITRKALSRIEQAERVLTQNGFSGCRVRYFGDTAKIEVMAPDMERLASRNMREKIVSELKKTGFLYITLDLEGYESGRLNRAIEKNEPG